MKSNEMSLKDLLILQDEIMPEDTQKSWEEYKKKTAANTKRSPMKKELKDLTHEELKAYLDNNESTDTSMLTLICSELLRRLFEGKYRFTEK